LDHPEVAYSDDADDEMDVRIMRTMSGNDLDWSNKREGGFNWASDEKEGGREGGDGIDDDDDYDETAAASELDKIDASIPIDDSPTPNTMSPKAIERVEMIMHESRTPIRGNMHARPKQKANAEEKPYGFLGLDGGVHPIVPSWVNQGTPPENLSQYLSVMQDLEASLKDEREQGRKERERMSTEIQQLQLAMNEKDMLLTEVVKRLKKTKREKVLVKDKLDKMTVLWDNDVNFRGFDIEGLGVGKLPAGPRSVPTSRGLVGEGELGEVSRGGSRPQTANALSINRDLFLRRNLKSSEGVRNLRHGLRKELLRGKVGR